MLVVEAHAGQARSWGAPPGVPPARDSCLPSVPTAAMVLRSTQEVSTPSSCMGVVRGVLVPLGARFALFVPTLVLR